VSTQEPIAPELRERVRVALDRSAADLDPQTAARLRSARREAVELAARPGRWRWRWNWPVLLAPAAALATLVLMIGSPPESPTATRSPLVAAPADAVRDLDLLTSSENLDLILDLDFYSWLPPAERS